MRARELVKKIKEVTKIDSREDTICFGDPDKEMKKVLVTWMATKKSIEYAIDNGFDTIISHEAFYFPYEVEFTEDKSYLSYKSNSDRIKLVEDNNITVVRLHSSVDELIILDTFIDELQLDGEIYYSNGFARIIKLKEPIKSFDLIEKLKINSRLMPNRFTKENKLVSKVGIAWGGMALFVNIGFLEILIENGADFIVAGESDSYGFHFVNEAGVSMVEYGHEVSENKGVCEFVKYLNKELNIDATYYNCERAYDL